MLIEKQFQHTWKSFLASGIAAGAVCLCLAACGSPNDPDGQASSGAESAPAQELSHGDFSGKKVAVSLPDSSGRWETEGALLEQLLKAEGCVVELAFAEEVPPKEDAPEGAEPVSSQAEDAARLIRDGCDVLIVAPEGENADLSLSVQAAREKGIPVISYDELLMDTDAVSYYVAYDSYKEGQLQGSFVAAALGLSAEDHSKEHHVEFSGGNPEDYRSAYLFNGAYDTLKPFLDSGALSVPSGQVTFFQVATSDGDAKNASARLEEILQTNYGGDLQLDAVLCSTDAEAAGAVEVLSPGKDKKKQVIITGLGAGEEALANVADGKQSMTLYEDREREALVAAALACSLLTGDAADANLIKDSGWGFACSYDTASYDNGKGIIPSYLLEPDIVTQNTINAAAQKSSEE